MDFKNQKGMTLIELIVSIALLAIIIIPVLGMLSASNLNNENARVKTTNGAVAQAVLEYYKKVDIDSVYSGSRPATLYIFCNKSELNGAFTPEKTVAGDDSVTVFTAVDAIAASIGAKPYEYAIRIFLSATDSTGMVQINVSVWDSINKDNNKVVFTSLRGN